MYPHLWKPRQTERIQPSGKLKKYVIFISLTGAHLCFRNPTGSTDCICFATVGTNDPVTSALHIVVGEWKLLKEYEKLTRTNNLWKIRLILVSYSCYFLCFVFLFVWLSQQVIRSQWMCVQFITMTSFSDTQSHCLATASMEMCFQTVRGTDGLALPDTTWQVCGPSVF